ncbi:MAG TPA: hypothetical protein VJM50_09630, partial [Pyrinomonadaceae bacterium]|nr:hypothetical protein [Pyrinomonadaceae bacterium]
MANSTDSSDLTGKTIAEIGGPFALGQWLADHDPFFKDHWTTWCSEIQSVQGVAQDTSVTVEAIVEVVRDNDVKKEDRKLVFKYTGPGVVNPLKISVQGQPLLQQAHDMVTASQLFDAASHAVHLPVAEVSAVTLPTIESGIIRLSPKPATVAPLPLAKPSESKIIKLPPAPESAPITIPEAEPVATALPKPTSPPSVKLPETTNDAVPVIPPPPAQETTLPSAKVVSAGQYLVPIDPFPSDFKGGETLADAIERVVGKGGIPPAISDVLGHLKVRKGFVVISSRFKGLVLEVEMDKPIRALVRLSLAKEKTVWAFGGEVIIARSAAKDGTPRPPLVFTLKIASSSSAKSLVMALAGEVDLIDDLLRPMFGDFTIPASIGLTVKNPVLVIAKKETTKALVGVSLAMSVDFGDLPFVGEAIKAQGDAKMSLAIQYASGPFLAAEIAEINSLISG